jgi:outer membrane biosynthesis protein TonB
MVALTILLVTRRSAPPAAAVVATTTTLDAAPSEAPPPPPPQPVVEDPPRKPLDIPIIEPPPLPPPLDDPKTTAPPPPPPKLPTKPAAPQSLAPRDSARISCKFGTEIELVWVAVPDATGYVVEVARDASFSSIATTLTAEKTVGVFRPLAPGVFHWRVTSHDVENTRSEPGGARQFTCTPD